MTGNKRKKARRPGRRPKTGVRRHRGGKIVRSDMGERPEEVMAVALSQPHRRAFQNPRDHLLGSALGVLAKHGEITDRQYWTGQDFRSMLMSFGKVSGIRVSGLRAPVFEMVSGGGLPPAAQLADIGDGGAARRWYERALGAVMSDPERGKDAWAALWRVCIDDSLPESWTELMDLRFGLDKIADGP